MGQGTPAAASGDAASGPVPGPSIGSSKHKRSRKKKWCPLNLSEIEPTVNTGARPRIPRSHRKSRASSARSQSPKTQPHSSEDNNNNSEGATSSFYVDPDITPTQATFFQKSNSVLDPTPGAPLVHREDSELTKNRLKDIMARLNDAFDSEEWDPTPPSDDRSNSPEPLMVKPQPVTYTTVGSLVKDNAIPQFTPPVRIQREGASRRPPQAPVQPRAHDGFFNPLNTTPQAGMGFTGPPQRTPQYSQQRQAIRSPHNLTEPEKEDLLKSLGVLPAIRPNNTPGASNLRAKADPFTLNPTSDTFNPQRMLPDISGIQSTQTFAPSPGFGVNMRNSLRHPYYSDPAHEAVFDRAARDRLSESSAASLRSYNQALPTPAPTGGFGSHDARIAVPDPLKRGQDPPQPNFGNPNLGYRLPPPGLSHPSGITSSSADRGFYPNYNMPGPSLTGISDSAPRFADYNPRSGNTLQNFGTQDTTHQQSQAKTGYPQPLTAGPPGQRQNTTGNRQNLMPLLSILTGNNRSGDSPSTANRPSNFGWTTSSGAYPRQNTFSSVPTEASKILDTTLLDNAMKYYPNGFPDDFSTPVQSFGKMSIADPDEEETLEDVEMKREEWWYHGVRRAHMACEDHLSELERREDEYDNFVHSEGVTVSPRSPIRPIRDYPVLTVDEINEMTDAEVAAPLLENLFGTLLGYADRIVTPNRMNMTELSGFGPSPPYQIDNSENGNNSVFDDDYGKVPARWARDPRNRDLN